MNTPLLEELASSEFDQSTGNILTKILKQLVERILCAPLRDRQCLCLLDMYPMKRSKVFPMTELVQLQSSPTSLLVLHIRMHTSIEPLQPSQFTEQSTTLLNVIVAPDLYCP